MIVVEGPDGAGKTTLIDTLVDRFSLSVEPRVVGKDTEAMVDLVRWVENDNRQPWKRTIYDRHRLISEPIYGAVLRPQAQSGFDDIDWLSDQMCLFYARIPLIIYCLPTRTIAWSNVVNDPDNRAVADLGNYIKLYSLYCARAAIDYSSNGSLIYNYCKQGARDQIMYHVKTYLQKREDS